MYSLYMLEDRLTEHLNAVDDEAQERMDILVRQMMEKQGVTEELKARDQMVWVGAVGFSINFVIMFHIPHFRNFVAGKQDDPVLPN